MCGTQLHNSDDDGDGDVDQQPASLIWRAQPGLRGLSHD